MKSKRVKKLLRKYFQWWIHWTGLGYWSVRAVFEKGIENIPGNLYLCGHVDAEWKYQTATVTFYPKAMRHLTPKEIEEAVVHEIMHVFLNEMQEDGMHHEERCATQLQKAFSWVKGARQG